MSDPINPLDKFQSYSYHWILLAANNTEIIRQFINPSIVGQPNLMSFVAGAKLGDEIGPNNSGAFLICDTRKTSEFAIDNVNYKMYIAPGDAPSKTHIIGGRLDIRLIDPSGVGFFNYMKYLVDEKFETDINGVTFLLHSLFMGHTDQGTTELVDSISIPMIMGESFSLTEFSTRGGIYDIGFFPITMGASGSISQFCELYETFSIKCKDALLGNAIQALENTLNIKSRDWFMKYNPIIKPEDKPVQDSQGAKNEDKRNGRLVQYMITIPDDWFYFKVNTSGDNTPETIFADKRAQYEKKATEVQQKTQASTTGKEAATSFSTAINMTIPDALASLLGACPQVNALSNLEAKKNGTSKIFKTISSISSDQETVLVHFDIVEYELPDVNRAKQVIEESNNTNLTMPRKGNDVRPENAIIYDYIFSGKNTDILNLDIKVNNLFLGLTSKANIAQQSKEQLIGKPQVKPIDRNETDDKTTLDLVRKKQPITRVPRTPNEVANNSSTPHKGQSGAPQRMADSQEFHKTLCDLHGATMMTTEMKIRGNPDLLKSYNIEGIPPHLKLAGSIKEFLALSVDDLNGKASAWEYKEAGINSAKPKAKAGAILIDSHLKHRTYINELVAPAQEYLKAVKTGKPKKSFIAQGTFVKINIFGPSEYPFSLDSTTNFRTQLFYDSWYVLSDITSSWTNGEFEQTLTLKTYDIYGQNSMTPQDKPTTSTAQKI